ncbi:MAG: MFS transporter [Planctomycetes bacterium]|nr:MFS transporter [Planctomycetota bacterium]
MTLLQMMTISALLATGMGVALLGSVKLSLARKLRLDEARVGGMVSTFGFVMIPVMLSVGFITDLVGKQPMMIGGSLVMAASLVVLALARTYRPALVGVLLLSAGWAILINVVNPLSLYAFPGTEIYAMNLACFFFGLGAFLTPLAAGLLLRRLGLTRALLLLAGAVLLTAVLAVGVDFSALGPASATASTAAPAGMGIGTLLAAPMMWLCALALFFYAPLEATMAAWATTYLTEKRVGERGAAGLLSGFWLAFMASRLVTAYTLPKGGEATLILVLALACIGVWAAVVFSRGRGVAMAMVVAAGLVFGPIFPTLMAVLLGHFDPWLHGRAVGLLFGIGGLGWSAIPMLIGAYARRTSVQRGFLLAAGSAVGLAAIALVLVTR